MVNARRRRRRSAALAGVAALGGTVAGLLSVVSVVDQPDGLRRLQRDRRSVYRGAIMQSLMAPATIVSATSLARVTRPVDAHRTAGYLGFRVAAAGLHLVGAATLPLLVRLSGRHATAEPATATALEADADRVRHLRDVINHVALPLAVCASDTLLYSITARQRLVPSWLSAWGLVAVVASSVASGQLLAGRTAVISRSYLAMNAPLAVQQVLFSGWLVVRGLRP